MSKNKYDWIKPGVHAWVAGLVCPVEVEVKYHSYVSGVKVICGDLQCSVMLDDIYQTEAECLAAMKLSK